LPFSLQYQWVLDILISAYIQQLILHKVSFSTSDKHEVIRKKNINLFLRIALGISMSENCCGESLNVYITFKRIFFVFNRLITVFIPHHTHNKEGNDKG
jgi:hypothetical protein